MSDSRTNRIGAAFETLAHRIALLGKTASTNYRKTRCDDSTPIRIRTHLWGFAPSRAQAEDHSDKVDKIGINVEVLKTVTSCNGEFRPHEGLEESSCVSHNALGNGQATWRPLQMSPLLLFKRSHHRTIIHAPESRFLGLLQQLLVDLR